MKKEGRGSISPISLKKSVKRQESDESNTHLLLTNFNLIYDCSSSIK